MKKVALGLMAVLMLGLTLACTGEEALTLQGPDTVAADEKAVFDAYVTGATPLLMAQQEASG